MNHNQFQNPEKGKEKEKGVVAQIKDMFAMQNISSRFNDVLGKKAAQFMASVVNVVSTSKALKECSANSILSAAFVAASLDLPIDSNLGFAAIVPYEKSYIDPNTGQWKKIKQAQFQIMYKGFIQLAIRSGHYKSMSYAVVYSDELVSYNPITNVIKFVEDFSNCSQRYEGNVVDVAGYYARFELITGFVQFLYMSKKEVENHARKYSKAYLNDLNKNEQKSKWSTDFEAMALKTVIKRLLSKWGILSIEMQRAITDDQKTFDENGDGVYGDNQPDEISAEDPFAIEQSDAEELPAGNKLAEQQSGGLEFEEIK